jgi:hypothetical protein
VGSVGRYRNRKGKWDQVGDIEVEMGSGICRRVKGADGRCFCWRVLEAG